MRGVCVHRTIHAKKGEKRSCEQFAGRGSRQWREGQGITRGREKKGKSKRKPNFIEKKSFL